MGMSRRWRVALTLTALALFGTASALAAPEGTHIGYMWPVGLASGALILTPRRQLPAVAVGVALLAAATYAVAGYPAQVCAGFGAAIALEALVAHRVMTSARAAAEPAGATGAEAEREPEDLGAFGLACLASAAAGAAGFALVAWAADFGAPGQVAIATFITHLAAEGVLLGLFRSTAGAPVPYGPSERATAWALTVTATLLAFTSDQAPGLAYLVIPPLGWVAFRASTREATVHLVAVGAISSTLTNIGHGPFAGPFVAGLEPEFQPLPLQLFLVACATVSIPFSMAVAMRRRAADQALRERARSERLVQSARGIAIIGTDEIGRINLFSPSAESILGYAPDEVYGQSTRMFHTDAELARQGAELGVDPTYVSVVRASADLPPGTAREWQFVRKDGIARTLSTILSPINDDRGRFVGYVATADDITDRIEAQEALRKALESERRAVRRLTEVDQVKDAFISSVSHELRTPITNIVGYVELLQDGIYDGRIEEQTDAMERIEQNSRRLLMLIDDLLTLSSLEYLDQRRRRGQVDLADVVRRAMEIVQPTLLRRDLDLAVEAPAEPVPVIGDPSELERLVINLATNAVKFTPDGGRIRVRLRDEGGAPVIEVEDSGIGIAEEDQARLFERFFRTDDAHVNAVQGSGLGLSIAKAITELHGGSIAASSVHGAGSVFRVTLPRAADADDEGRTPPA